MAFKEVEVTVSQNVALYRTCEFCGHEYKFIRQASATGKSGWGKDSKQLQSQARDNARERLEEREPAVFDDEDGVVCPKCGRFSSVATRRHFPDGIRTGLQKKLRTSGIVHFIGSVITIITLTVLAIVQYQHWDTTRKGIHELEGLSPLVGYFFLGAFWLLEIGFFGFALFGLVHARRASRDSGRLSAISDKRLHVIAVKACLDTGNSLTGNSLMPFGFVYNLVSHIEAFFRPAEEASSDESRESSSRRENSPSRGQRATAPKTTVECRDCGVSVSVPIAKAGKRVRCETCTDRRLSRDALQRKYGFTKGTEVYERLQTQPPRVRRRPKT